MSQRENPDEIINIEIEECPDCKTDLKNIEAHSSSKRQEFDIDASHLKVTEYQSHTKKCAKCKKKVTIQIPQFLKIKI